MGLANIIGNSARAYRDGHVFWTNSFAQLINYEDKSPHKAVPSTLAPKSNTAGKFLGAITGLPYGLIKSIIIATHHNYEDSFTFIGKLFTKIEPSPENAAPNQSKTHYIHQYDKPATIAARLLLGIIGVIPAVALSPLPLGFGLLLRIGGESAMLGGKTFDLMKTLLVNAPQNKTIDTRSRIKRTLGALAGLPGFFIAFPFGLTFGILEGLVTPHSRLRGFLAAPVVHIYKNWLFKPLKRVGEEILHMGTNEFNPVRFKANLIAVFTLGLGKSLYKKLSGNTEMVYPHKKQAWNAQHAEFVGENSVELIKDYELFNTIHKEEPVSIVAGVRKTFGLGCNPSPVKETLSTLLHGYNQYRKSDASDKSLKNYLESESALKNVNSLKMVYSQGDSKDMNKPNNVKIDAVVGRLKR